MNPIKDGVWPTMVTPFTADNRIDYAGVEQIISFYAQRGAAGIFAICQSSEMFFLSPKERAELAKFIAGHTPPGMEVIVSGHTSTDPDAQLREAEAMMCEGISAYVVLPNRFADAGESDDVLLERMQKFADRCEGIPLGIYECPYPYKRTVSPKVLKWCADSGKFLFLKDTCSDPAQIAEKLAIAKGSGLKLFNANTATLLESLRGGAAGFSGVMGNFHPELYVWLCQNYRKHPETAQKLQELLTVCSLIENSEYPVCAKYYLQLEGLKIGLYSRSNNPKNFTEAFRINVSHLRGLIQSAKKILEERGERIL